MFGKKFKLFRLMGFEVSVDTTWIILAVLVENGRLKGIIALKDLLNFLSTKIELEEV